MADREGVNVARWQERPGTRPRIVKQHGAVAVALTMSIGVGFLMLHGWQSPPASLFLRTIILGLSATTAFTLFEVWPLTCRGGSSDGQAQVVAVGVCVPVTTVLIYVLSTPEGRCPSGKPCRMDGWTHLTFAGFSSRRGRRSPRSFGRRKRLPAIEADVRARAQ